VKGSQSERKEENLGVVCWKGEEGISEAALEVKLRRRESLQVPERIEVNEES